MSSIQSSIAYKVLKALEECVDYKLAQEPYISSPTQPQQGRIEEHVSQEQGPHEPAQAANKNASTTMDWSYGNLRSKISRQKATMSLSHEHERVEACGLCVVDDFDMERGTEGDSKDEAILERPLNLRKKKLRKNAILDFVNVISKKPDGVTSVLSAIGSKQQNETGTGRLTCKVWRTPIHE